MKTLKNIFVVSVFCISLTAAAFAQTGGTFDLSHSVIAASGAANTSGGTFSLIGTVGQPVAGTASGGAQYDLYGGFWIQNLAPTAAGVSISGRIRNSDGNGIRGVQLTLTSPNGAVSRTTSSTFGYYRFDNIEVGHTYVLQLASKRFSFAEPTRVFSLQSEIVDLDFTALMQ